jgi:hypothetical protein
MAKLDRSQVQSYKAIRQTQLHKLPLLPQVTRHLDSAYIRGSCAGGVSMNPNDKPATDDTKPKSSPNIQGEGDYESTRRFDADAKRFLKDADVPDLARRAAPKSKEEAAEMKQAEEIGRSHRAGAKGSDAKASDSPDSTK